MHNLIFVRNYFKNIAKHSDSMMEDGIATNTNQQSFIWAITLHQDNYIVIKATPALLGKDKKEEKCSCFHCKCKMPQFYFIDYFKNIVEHSDSMIEDGIATAAWRNLFTAISPACCQDSVEGSQRKISVKELYQS